MEDLTIRRRNRLRHHYTTTSNVLLFGYRHVPDAAKLTYQVIDSFDWSDGAGLRKGYAYPAVRTLAEIRGVDERTIQRHLTQLERACLVSREARPGRPNLLVIEDPSPAEAQRYLETWGRGERGDENVTPTPDRNVTPHLEEAKEQERQTSLTKIDQALGEERGYQPIGELVKARRDSIRIRSEGTPPAKAKREWLAWEVLKVLKDKHSFGFYRKVADTVPEHRVFEALSEIRQALREGVVLRNRGAYFASLVGE